MDTYWPGDVLDLLLAHILLSGQEGRSAVS
jgi:hypothetical protein